MRKCYLLFTLLFFAINTQPIFAQSGKWTWMHGTNNPADLGNYGTKGIASATNMPPSRYQAAYWTDLNGNFWLFGGVGVNDIQNDLWKYDVATNMWTWMSGAMYQNNMAGDTGIKGVPSINNFPSARGYGANCWTDKNNNLWLYSGYSNDNSNDLWKYNIATNEWTWMNGNQLQTSAIYGTLGIDDTLNTPGSRQEIKSGWVTTDNKLWLFGGQDNSGTLDDIWRYNIATNSWAWMKGSSTGIGTPNYGTKGIETATNQPPSRWSYTKWKDVNDNFYIFAGQSSDINYNGQLNDCWKYNPATNNWSWVSGTSIVDDLGSSPNFCTNNIDSFPSARFENQTVSTIGCNQAFWSFGGWDNMFKTLNDLWLFNTLTYKWTLVSGTNDFKDQAGSFGIKGVYSASNMIPSKAGVCIWTDNNNNLWVFGGFAIDATFTMSHSNDLWKFQPDTSCFNTSLSSNFSIPRPTDTVICDNQNVALSLPKMALFHLLPLTGVTFNTDTSTIFFQPNTTTTYTLSGTSINSCPGSDTIVFTIVLDKSPIADFNISPTSTTTLNPTFLLTNTSTNAIKYEWYYKHLIFSTQTNTQQTFTDTGKYCFTLVAFNKAGCVDSITKCAKIGLVIPDIPDSDATVFIPNVFSPNGDGVNDILKAITTRLTTCEFEIFNRWGNQVFTTTDPSIGWNGEYKNAISEIGTYYYIFKYKLKNGEAKILKGDIILIQ